MIRRIAEEDPAHGEGTPLQHPLLQLIVIRVIPRPAPPQSPLMKACVEGF
jgi:hypothetical protein